VSTATGYPSDWETRTLGTIGSSLIGLTYRPSDVRSSGTLVLRSSNIQNGSLSLADTVFVDVEVPERIILLKNDILICVRNGSRKLIGKCLLIDERTAGETFGAFMGVFRSPHNQFLFHCFQSDIIKRQIDAHLGATINQITNASLNSFEVPFPPEPERSAIAEALSDIAGLIRSQEALLEKKRSILKGAMQQLLSGRTRLPGHSQEWVTATLGELASQSRAQVNPARHPERLYQHFSIPAFDEGREPVMERGLSIGSIKFMVPPNCVLVSKLNPRIPRVWAPVGVTDVAIASTEFVVMLPSATASREFLKWLLQSASVADRMALLATGTTGSHQRIHPRQVMEIEVKIPATAGEQEAIAQALDDMEAGIAVLRRQLAKSHLIKQGMLQQLLTGRTRLMAMESAA
jgi:type I restriction enzyme, S subunit